MSLRKSLEAWIKGSNPPERVGLGRSGIVVMLFATAIVLGLVASRGAFGARGLAYGFAHHALLIASGRMAESPRDHLMWPPGYPLTMVPLIWLGLAPLRAAWMVSLVAFGATVSLTFLLGRRLGHTALGLGAAGLLLLNASMLEQATVPMSEMLFSASLLAAILVFDVFFVHWTMEKREIRWGRTLATGLALAAPVWVRYIGLVLPLLAIMCMVALGAACSERRRPLIMVVLWTGLFIGLLPLRNVLMAGSATGHPIGAPPADTLGSAMSQALRDVRTMWFFLAERLPRTFVDTATALVLLAAAAWGARRARWSIASSLAVVYLGLLCWIASHSRIDKMHERFILPIVPVMVVTVWGALTDALRRGPRARSWLRRLAAGIVLVAAVAGGVSVSRGLTLLAHGYSPASTYSPATIAYIRTQVPAGAIVAVNQRQISAHTLTYHEVVMPWAEPGEDNWPKAYGILPWHRAEALRSFLDNHIEYVVLFLGPAGDYRWLERAYPGDYIASTLVTESVPEVASRVKLADGVVVILADRSHLQEALQQAQRAVDTSR